MNSYLDRYTDRELLESVYMMLIQVLSKVNEIDDDKKTFGMNLAADLVGNVMDDMVSSRRTRK